MPKNGIILRIAQNMQDLPKKHIKPLERQTAMMNMEKS